MASTLASSASDMPTGQANMVCFSELADRLACDPANTTWVYGVYTYKYDVTDAQAQSHIRSLIDRLLARAARHYAESVVVFRRLSERERQAHVIRGVAPVSRPIELPFLFLPRGHASQGSPSAVHHASVAPSANVVEGTGVVDAPTPGGGASARGSVSITSGAPAPVSARRRTSLSTARAGRAVHTISEEDARDALMKHWPALPASQEEQVRDWLRQHTAQQAQAKSSQGVDRHRAGGGSGGGVGAAVGTRNPTRVYSVTALSDSATGDAAGTALMNPLGVTPRVRVVVDIIASRKTLGATADITQSPPYNLGQYVYDYVQQRTTPSARMAHKTERNAAFTRDTADWLSESVDVVADVVLRHLVVTVTTVAISDAANKLAGRDVLFPYRGFAASTTSAAAVARGVAINAASHPAGENSNAAAIDQLLSTSPAMMLLFPSQSARLPPVQRELIDQSRMVICFPRMASMAKS